MWWRLGCVGLEKYGRGVHPIALGCCGVEKYKESGKLGAYSMVSEYNSVWDIGDTLGIYSDNGKENGNYYDGVI